MPHQVTDTTSHYKNVRPIYVPTYFEPLRRTEPSDESEVFILIMLSGFLIISIIGLITGQGYDILQDTNLPLRKCLGCICEASTGCNPKQGCHNAGPSAYYCGPYLISWAYWAEAGRPGSNPGNPHDFEVCLKTFECSEQAIYGYMRKWLYDCDRDGDIDCDDVSSIHKAGPYGCNGTWFYNTDYWKLYQNCYAYQ